MDYDKLQTDFIEIIDINIKLIYKVSHLYCDNAIDIEDLFQNILSNLWMSGQLVKEIEELNEYPE